MPRWTDNYPSYETLIRTYVDAAAGPLPVAELIDHVLANHPSTGKKPASVVRHYIHEALGRHLIFIDKDTILSLRLAWLGIRFRLPLHREIIHRGLMDISETLPPYLPARYDLKQVRFVDVAGQPLQIELHAEKRSIDTPFGKQNITAVLANLGGWLRAQGTQAADQLLLTVVDWENGVLQLAREPASELDPALLAMRNLALANLFFDLLENARQEDSLTAWEAVPTVYARMPDKTAYPPDHWVAVLAADGRMRTDGISIRYRDGRLTPLEALFLGDTQEADELRLPALSKAAQAQVYRFKAMLVNRTNLWRTIEIQGKQTLADLDRSLRHAFKHGSSDHLSGFWQLVPRGRSGQAASAKGKAALAGRFREIKLGDIHPFGGGDAAGTQIAQLGLEVGAQLKYVYDFGDWIQHRLSLEAIEAPSGRAKYPREVGRNAPELLYCVECRARGRQTVAKWLCRDDSDRIDDNVVLCDDCAQKRHEDHYLDEILY